MMMQIFYLTSPFETFEVESLSDVIGIVIALRHVLVSDHNFFAKELK